MPEALCFRVVRPSVRTGISLTRNLKNPWVDFYHTWPRGAPWWVDELIRVGRDPPKVKGQWTWSKYVIFTSLTQNLKNLWVDFHQTWYRGAPPGVDELIRFWARSAQRQRSMNLVSICYFYLVNTKSQEPPGGFSSNLVQGAPPGVDELIRFWARSAQGQRSKVGCRTNGLY